MKRILLLFLLSMSATVFAQQVVEADRLVDEGIALHDKGDYEGALKKYDEALQLDKNNFSALAEKALTTLSMGKPDEAIRHCQTLLKLYPGDSHLKNVYVTLGNAHDSKNDLEKSLGTYDEGIKQFPDFYQLYFNKGISLAGAQRFDEAIPLFHKAIMLNPMHPGSNHALARLLEATQKRIPSILAYSRFLILEPQSRRAKENLVLLQKAMMANVEEKGKGTTITISPDLLNQVESKEKTENDFSTTDMTLTFAAALDSDKKNKKKSDVENFIRKFTTVCNSMEELKPNNSGFYWEYYAPYFIEMENKKFLETFSYVAFVSSGDADVSTWLDSHKADLEKFYEWSKNFAWKTK